MYDIALLEYLGIFAFAASGAYVAIDEKFDLFGIYILATVTGAHIAQHISLVTIFSVRMICYIKKINLPVITRT